MNLQLSWAPDEHYILGYHYCLCPQVALCLLWAPFWFNPQTFSMSRTKVRFGLRWGPQTLISVSYAITQHPRVGHWCLIEHAFS